MNRSFCIRAFNHVAIAPNGAVKLCCRALGYAKRDGAVESIESRDFSGIWNGDYYKQIREKMLSGETIPECSSCYRDEELVGGSVRTRTLADWRNGFLNPGKMTLDELVADANRRNFLADYPVDFDLHLGNACNLRCRMCSGLYSSSIAADKVQSRWRPRETAPFEIMAKPQEVLLTRRVGAIYKHLGSVENDENGAPYIDVMNGTQIRLPEGAIVREIVVVHQPSLAGEWVLNIKADNILIGQISLARSPARMNFSSIADYGGLLSLTLVALGRPNDEKTVRRIRTYSIAIAVSFPKKTRRWYNMASNVEAQLIANAQELGRLVLVGGEPMASKQTRDILDMLISDGRADNLFLNITTNGTKFEEADFDRLRRFKRADIALSLDGVGRTGEYIRHGCKQTVVVDAIARLRELPNIAMRMAPTLQAYNLLDICALFDFARERGISPGGTVLDHPSFLAVEVLPRRIREVALHRLRERREMPACPRELPTLNLYVARLQANLDAHHDERALSSFLRYTQELDDDRGECFATALPELSEMLADLGYAIPQVGSWA
ncbi:MAG: SPASM domain-containing protein [Candidatus Accumulibacter sp.]|nr:SPASM domain-containing protein [Accumulibacter sp.]